ncbi:interference hedgehog-like [Ctenocephalides felis]|uniref:interference hedgehog-like n=1 Tax=Ctenocephalides felis TaxID=7515 RepID=UPI000E6E4956|nr:interference hedgehog-like [Ctenocephalides felis]
MRLCSNASFSLTAERLTWLHQPEGGNRSESDYKELNEHADFDKDGYQMSFHGMVGSLRVLADPHLPTGSGKFRCSVRFGPLSLVSTPARLELAALDDFRLDAEWIASQRDSDGLRLRAPVGSRVMMRCPEVKSSPQAVIQFYK